MKKAEGDDIKFFKEKDPRTLKIRKREREVRKIEDAAHLIKLFSA